jgi:hypothetical protein
MSFLKQEIAIAANANSAGAQVIEGTGPVTMASKFGFPAIDAAGPSIGGPAPGATPKFG